MSLSNALFSPSYTKNEDNIKRLKTISKSINIYDIYNYENNPNKQLKEKISIYNYKNYKNKNDKIISNNQSLGNIFNSNKKYNYSPIKIYSNNEKNNNNSIQNNLNTIDYSYTKELILERKISAKSIKHKNKYSSNKIYNIYNNNSVIYEPFSSKRILTIPTQSNHFGYAIYDNGETELLDDPNLLDKFNGTKNNSIGPGQYNIIPAPRRKLIIDWSKLSENRLLNKKIRKLGELNKLDNLYLSTNIMNEKEKQNESNENYSIFMNNKSKSINNININKIRNKIFRNNNIHLKDYRTDSDYINLTSLNYIKKKNEEKTIPGPGSYNYNDEFKIIPKKNKYQNFGSFVSRDLMLKSPKKKKNNKFENYIKYSFFSNINIDDKKYNMKKSENEKSKIYKNSKNYIEKIKIEELKDKNIEKKKEELIKLGPGSYNPDINKIKRINKIENFGSLEKRKLTTGNLDTPKITSYLPLNDWTEKYNYKLKTIETESIERKYKLNLVNKKKDKEKIEIKIEKNKKENNIDYDNKILNLKNKLKVGFGSKEPRFHIFKSQINELNGVGKYNLLPLKKNKKQFSPFIYSSSRSNLIKNDNNKNVGPGSYNDYDTFYEWNKKTYNVKVKDRIDIFKTLKK